MLKKFKLRSDCSEVFLNGRFYTDKERIFSENKEVIDRFKRGFLYEVVDDPPKVEDKPKTTRKK